MTESAAILNVTTKMTSISKISMTTSTPLILQLENNFKSNVVPHGEHRCDFSNSPSVNEVVICDIAGTNSSRATDNGDFVKGPAFCDNEDDLTSNCRDNEISKSMDKNEIVSILKDCIHAKHENNTCKYNTINTAQTIQKSVNDNVECIQNEIYELECIETNINNHTGDDPLVENIDVILDKTTKEVLTENSLNEILSLQPIIKTVISTGWPQLNDPIPLVDDFKKGTIIWGEPNIHANEPILRWLNSNRHPSPQENVNPDLRYSNNDHLHNMVSMPDLKRNGVSCIDEVDCTLKSILSLRNSVIQDKKLEANDENMLQQNLDLIKTNNNRVTKSPRTFLYVGDLDVNEGVVDTSLWGCGNQSTGRRWESSHVASTANNQTSFVSRMTTKSNHINPRMSSNIRPNSDRRYGSDSNSPFTHNFYNKNTQHLNHDPFSSMDQRKLYQKHTVTALSQYQDESSQEILSSTSQHNFNKRGTSFFNRRLNSNNLQPDMRLHPDEFDKKFPNRFITGSVPVVDSNRSNQRVADDSNMFASSYKDNDLSHNLPTLQRGTQYNDSNLSELNGDVYNQQNALLNAAKLLLQHINTPTVNDKQAIHIDNERFQSKNTSPLFNSNYPHAPAVNSDNIHSSTGKSEELKSVWLSKLSEDTIINNDYSPSFPKDIETPKCTGINYTQRMTANNSSNDQFIPALGNRFQRTNFANTKVNDQGTREIASALLASFSGLTGLGAAVRMKRNNSHDTSSAIPGGMFSQSNGCHSSALDDSEYFREEPFCSQISDNVNFEKAVTQQFRLAVHAGLLPAKLMEYKLSYDILYQINHMFTLQLKLQQLYILGAGSLEYIRKDSLRNHTFFANNGDPASTSIEPIPHLNSDQLVSLADTLKRNITTVSHSIFEMFEKFQYSITQERLYMHSNQHNRRFQKPPLVKQRHSDYPYDYNCVGTDPLLNCTNNTSNNHWSVDSDRMILKNQQIYTSSQRKLDIGEYGSDSNSTPTIDFGRNFDRLSMTGNEPPESYMNCLQNNQCDWQDSFEDNFGNGSNQLNGMILNAHYHMNDSGILPNSHSQHQMPLPMKNWNASLVNDDGVVYLPTFGDNISRQSSVPHSSWSANGNTTKSKQFAKNTRTGESSEIIHNSQLNEKYNNNSEVGLTLSFNRLADTFLVHNAINDKNAFNSQFFLNSKLTKNSNFDYKVYDTSKYRNCVCVQHIQISNFANIKSIVCSVGEDPAVLVYDRHSIIFFRFTFSDRAERACLSLKESGFNASMVSENYVSSIHRTFEQLDLSDSK